MSINGVLEDLPLADVLQFVHLGRRTGTLYMWQGEKERAEIGFHDGRIISAWTPGQRRLGNLLVARQLIDNKTLEEALALQRTQGEDPTTIGQILIEHEAITQEQIYEVIRDQVQATIFDLVSWRHGYFQFEVDELHPSDDFAVSPKELLDNLDLNTQMLVLEATRLFDEKHRKGKSEEPTALDTSELSRLEMDFERTGLTPADKVAEHIPDLTTKVNPPAQEAIRCQVVSDDPNLVATLAAGLPPEKARVLSVPLREAGNRIPGESTSPIVVLDLRAAHLAASDIATLARTRPAAAVVALVNAATDEHASYESGALAVVSSENSIVDSCRSLIRILTHPQPGGGLVLGMQGGFRRFRRVVFDVQSGLASATMALNLMHVISDSVERAVLFLVQQDHLVAVGAFGSTHDRGSGPSEIPLAEATHRLKLQIEPGGLLERVVRDAEPQKLNFDDAELPPLLADLVGRPTSGQFVLFPVLGAERTISVIYTDNGALDKEIEDVRILELATSQVGMAFENELLRQQAGSEDFGDE